MRKDQINRAHAVDLNLKQVKGAVKNVNALLVKGSNSEILDALKKLNKLLDK